MHPRVDRAVLADLVSQSMDIVEPREVSDEQSDVTTECLEDWFPALPTARVHQYAVPLGKEHLRCRASDAVGRSSYADNRHGRHPARPTGPREQGSPTLDLVATAPAR